HRRGREARGAAGRGRSYSRPGLPVVVDVDFRRDDRAAAARRRFHGEIQMIGVLMRHLWRRHRVTLIVMSAALGLVEFLFTRFAPAPNELNWMAGILRSMPPQLIAILGGEAAIASTTGVLAVGYTHPFFLLLLSVWVIRVPSSALAGEIGQGTMDLIGSRP